LTTTGVLFGIMAVGLLLGYANGPHDPYSATHLGQSSQMRFTVGQVFVHNLLVVVVPLILFPILFWAPAATSAVTGYSVGQIIAAWLALHLPERLLVAGLLPHGVVEIPAILLGGTLTWRIGMAAWRQRTFGGSWGERAQAAVRAAVPVIVVVVAALGVAAFIEVKVTPLVVARLAGY
jgi:stage II sporulation protein M